MKTAVLRSAEEITRVKGCTSFGIGITVFYDASMKEFARKRFELRPSIDNSNYDFTLNDGKEDICHVKKEWLTDFQDKTDWSKVKMNAVVKTPDGLMHFAEYAPLDFGLVDTVTSCVWVWSSGKTSFTTTYKKSFSPDLCELVEEL